MESIKIQNSLDLAVIDIEGTIGVPEQWQFETPDQRVATYEKFRQTLEQLGEISSKQVVVNIRSTGGDVNDALLIYEALTALDATITTRCYGYVASAATVIAQAASAGQREISPNALYLVHNSSCVAEGNADDLASRVDLLRKTDESLAQLYARHAGSSAEEFAALMAEDGGNGRWLAADEVVELKLADSLIEGKSESVAPATVQNIWQKVGKKLGLQRASKPKIEVHDVLHDAHEAIGEQHSQIAMQEGQLAAKPTELESVEDPSLGDATLSQNAKAYSQDAMRMRL